MTKNQNYVQFNMLEGSRNLLIITRTLAIKLKSQHLHKTWQNWCYTWLHNNLVVLNLLIASYFQTYSKP